ncbi:afg1-family atpase [Nannochloropsis oceanica]
MARLPPDVESGGGEANISASSSSTSTSTSMEHYRRRQRPWSSTCNSSIGSDANLTAFNLLHKLPTFRHHLFFQPATPAPSEGGGSNPLSTSTYLTPGGDSGGAGPDEQHLSGGSSLVDIARRRFWRWTVWRRLYHSSVVTVLKQQSTPLASFFSPPMFTPRRRSSLDSTYTKPTPFLFSTPDAGPVIVASSSTAFNSVHLVTRAAAPEQKSLVYVNGTEVSGHLKSGVVLPSPPSRFQQTYRSSKTAKGEGGDVVVDPRAPLSLSLMGEFCIDKPAYLHIAPTKAGTTPLLWVTQFSLTRRGSISGINIFGKGRSSVGSTCQKMSSPSLPRSTSPSSKPVALSSPPQQQRQQPQRPHAQASAQLHPPPPSTLLLQDQQPPPSLSSSSPSSSSSSSNPIPEEMKLGFSFRWPNEVYNLPPHTITGCSDEALLVADGFLMPGRSDGGLYVVQDPGKPSEKVTSLTRHKPGWFYHKATWVDLLGPGGRPCLLTARATKPFFAQTEGELVLLMQPEGPFPLAEWNTPWEEVVLVKGPDVMFDVVDLDPEDDVLEVFAAEFFSRRLTLHRLRKGDWKTGRKPRVLTSEVLDHALGPAYSVVLADLKGYGKPSHVLVSSHECQYEGLVEGGRKEEVEGSGVTTAVAGADLLAASEKFAGPGLQGMAARAAVLGSSNSGSGSGMGAEEEGLKGGSLFAYEIPSKWRERVPWKRSTLATGFHVKSWGQINPGAPGFPYVFYPHRSLRGQAGQRPYILLAGDCSHAAYIYRPVGAHAGEGGGGEEEIDVRYEPMAQINCGGTVGSLAVGHLPLAVGGEDEGGEEGEEEGDGWAKIFIPNFDTDKVYAFSFGPEKASPQVCLGLDPLSVPSERYQRLEVERKARVAEEDEIVGAINTYAKTRGDKTKIS